jgi:hypothetical protein
MSRLRLGTSLFLQVVVALAATGATGAPDLAAPPPGHVAVLASPATGGRTTHGVQDEGDGNANPLFSLAAFSCPYERGP